jgi:lipoprotein-releasing system permease protein
MLALKIAARYLLAPKSHSAISAITIVAACGMAIITAALVCVLSVYNGFESLVGTLTSRLDPELKVEPREGKFFDDNAQLRRLILSHPDVEQLSATLTETVLIANSGCQVPARMKGVDSLYREVTRIDSILWNGEYKLSNGVSDFAILGVGLSQRVNCRPGFLRPMTFFCPRREGKIKISDMEGALVSHDFFCSAQFAVQQSEYDDDLCLVSLSTARQLLQDSTLCSAYELRLRPGANDRKVARELQQMLSSNELPKTLSDKDLLQLPSKKGLQVLTRNEQQADSYRIVRVEKWITYLLISFILLIASFNLTSALSMLIIDKENDTRTLRSLGADDKLIKRIFVLEGALVTGAGIAAGLIIGIGLCLLQQHLGIIGLGDGSSLFVVDSYPVVLQWSDTLWVALTVAAIGLLATTASTSSIGKMQDTKLNA